MIARSYVDTDPSATHFGLGAIAARLLAVLVLVLANALFVAAEFALVSARRSKIDAAAAGGDRTARLIQSTHDRLYRYISGTQLGVTLSSLALGYIGEEALAELGDIVFAKFGLPVPAHALHTAAAVVVGFLLLTYLHIVLGELVPKAIALANPEGVSRVLVRPLRWFSTVCTPFIWLLNSSATAMLRLFGVKSLDEATRVHSPEELRMLVLQTTAHGRLDETESTMLARVFDFASKKARDVMRPRTEIVAISIDASEAEVRGLLRTEGYSRYPVYREDLDDILGLFLAKDLWLYEGAEPFSLTRFVRDAHFVPDSRPADRLLDDLRRTRAHMAIVLDEYGGTSGIVTMEDLVEEVVGDISDEYDATVRESLEMNGVLELAGSLSLIDVRSDHHVQIPDGSWSTLGGYVFSRLGRLPRMGDRVPFPNGELEVVAMDGRRVAAVRVHRTTHGDREKSNGSAMPAAARTEPGG
ncbi:MAG: hemolysin family protein [Gemmatimonadota bacterium]|nr:hemolysin family protein [Gemmatimonadota bacterium]